MAIISPPKEIIFPSKKEVRKYCKDWNNHPDYKEEESSLQKLFTVTYPSNDNMDDVLIKVSALQGSYSTKSLSPLDIARHIVNLKIDNRLSAHNPKLVNSISLITADAKRVNIYPFATKYCSYHYPEGYPIFDLNIEKIVMYFNQKHKFYIFQRNDLRSYTTYIKILTELMQRYKLEGCSLKDVSRYLCQAGKYYFPTSRRLV